MKLTSLMATMLLVRSMLNPLNENSVDNSGGLKCETVEQEERGTEGETRPHDRKTGGQSTPTSNS